MAETQRRENKLQSRARELVNREIAFVDHESFRDPNLVIQMEDVPEGLHLDAGAGDGIFLSPTDGISSSILVQSKELPLLTAEQEQWLFRKMNWLKSCANQLRVQLKLSKPDPALCDQIDLLLKEAIGIRNRIVQSNLRLVVSIASRMVNRRSRLDDLVSDGYLSLIRALEKFDFSRGYRFSTYATHAIQRDAYRRYQQKQREESRKLPQITIEGLSSEHTPIQEDEQKLDLLSRIRDLVETELDERESFILRARFGLGKTGKPQKLRTIAEALGLSKERVRQLQIQAIEKLQESLSSHAWG